VSSPQTYALEQLYQDQDRDWVIGTIPAVLAWVPGGGRRRQPYAFEIEHISASNGRPRKLSLAVGWSVEALERHDPRLRDDLRRMRAGRTVQREHIVELAGYGLALCAISVLLPGERVVDMERGRSPDFLFEASPASRRGVEVGCRTQGGWPTLRSVRKEKTTVLMRNRTLAEVHLSLWCGSPRVAEFHKVKP
jgi:hypothetical protein